jgi:hypothetical protein
MAVFVEEWLKLNTSLAPHLALVGRSGTGKTGVVHVLLSRVLRKYFHPIIVLDWEEEYTDMPLPIHAPPFPVPFLHHLLSNALIATVGRFSELDHAIAGWLTRALNQNTSLIGAATELRKLAPYSLAALTASSLLELVWRYIEPEVLYNEEEAVLEDGVYLLSKIPSIHEREAVQKFLAMLAVLLPRMLGRIIVIEKKWLNDDWFFFRRLFNYAGSRNRIVFTSDTLPPPDILSNCELLLFDCDREVRRALKAPIPDTPLKPGECWWVRRTGSPRKLRFELR